MRAPLYCAMRRWLLLFMLFLAAREAADAAEPMPVTPLARFAALDEPAAARFAALALKCLHEEYPNHISHTLSSDAGRQASA